MPELIIFILLLALGYGAGTVAERRHYRSIEEREKAFLKLPTLNLKTPPCDPSTIASSRLVYGSVVISVDYFKRILAALRNIFGGDVKSYETLIDRARREATLRMKEVAADAEMIVNVRIETSSIAKNSNNRKSIGSLEAIAYGTAIKLRKTQA